MAESTFILGLDPGLSITGYGVLRTSGFRQVKLVEGGVLRIPRTKPIEQRLLELHTGLKEILETHTIAAIAIEQLYSHYERPRTAILMGHARGVLCMTAAEHGIPVFSYASTKVKKLLTGTVELLKTRCNWLSNNN